MSVAISECSEVVARTRGAEQSRTLHAEGDERIRKWVLATICISLAFGVAYAISVRPGTPYDEPSHFDTVKFYGTHWRMPVVGEPGTSYEAFQAPLYYELAGVIYRVAARHGERLAFFTVRIIGLLLLLPAIMFCHTIVRQVTVAQGRLALVVTLFLALNPSVLGIASSIQNDMLAIVMCLGVTAWVVSRRPEEEIRCGPAFLLGVFVGLAVLSKLTALFLAAAVVLYLLYRGGKRAILAMACFIVAAAIVSGWWFLRNRILYGDWTAASAAQASAGNITLWRPVRLWRPSGAFTLFRSIITYLWIPVEYYRNLVHAPSWMRGLVCIVTVMSGLGWGVWIARVGRRREWQDPSRSQARWFLAGSYVLCMGVYLHACATKWALGARMTLPTFPVAAILFVGGGVYLADRHFDGLSKAYVLVLGAGLILCNVYLIWVTAHLPVFVFNLFGS